MSAFVLEKSFRTTHAMLLLHMWLTLVRLRAEGKDGAKVGQTIYELFNHDLEKRIVAAGVSSYHQIVVLLFSFDVLLTLKLCQDKLKNLYHCYLVDQCVGID
jgi:hypothetical protein